MSTVRSAVSVHLLVLALLAAAAPRTHGQVQQTGAASSRAPLDVPGSPSFRPAARVLFADDWSSTAVGEVPRSIALVAGTVEVVEDRGFHFLRIGSDADFDIPLPEVLPEEFTIEMDAMLPGSWSNPTWIRPEVRGARPGIGVPQYYARGVVMLCGQNGAGVMGETFSARKNTSPDLAPALVSCQISVRGSAVRVYYAGETAANVPEAKVFRSNRVRFHVPFKPGYAPMIAAIRIAAGGPSMQVASGETTTGGSTAGPTTGTSAGTTLSRPPVEPVETQPRTTTGTTGTTGTTPSVPPTGIGASGAGTVAPGGARGTPTAVRTAATAAVELRAKGVPVTAAATALMQEFSITDAAAAKTLVDATYPLVQVLSWLSSDRGYDLQKAYAFLVTYPAVADLRTVVLALNQVYAPALLDLATWLRTRYAMPAQDLVTALLGLPSAPGGTAVSAWVTLLQQSGYDWLQVTEALRYRFNRSPEQVASDLLLAKAAIDQIALALVNSYNQSAEQIVSLLRQRGVAVDPLAAVLVSLFEQPRGMALTTLRGAGFDLTALVKALNGVFGVADVNTVVDVLRREVNASVVDIVTALHGLLGTTQQTAQTATQLAQALVRANADPKEIVAAFHGVLQRGPGEIAGDLRGAQVGVATVATALQQQLALTQQQLGAALTGGGFTAAQVALGLKAGFTQITASSAAVVLAATGWDVSSVADAIVQAFSLSLEAVLQLLAGLGIK